MPGRPTPVPTSDASPIVSFRTAFFSGLLLLAPLWVTIWAFFQVIALLGGTFRPLYEHLLPDSLQRIPFLWDFLSTIVVLGLITLIGYLSRYVFGKYFLEVGERIIHGIPGLGHVYNTVKQIVDTFGSQNRNVFSKVVLVQFPRQGAWTLGFLTNKAQGEAQLKTGAGELWTVFVPTTPNPTGGYLLMFPPHEVIELEMSVGDGMKMIISGGAVVPPWPAPKPTA
ncbi:MAG: DUF502 domain-containing protein [Verrucomicrobia bacterium]|nr:DUF502 domain-containing protein [Verrucomicrobiota bacterium]